MLKQLPIGIDEFKHVRMGNYAYVDKSLFIKELIESGPYKVTLIPRPRRFGKTLNMTMLKCFFENTQDKDNNKEFFDGLAISKDKTCMAHQGQYPVIYLTLKNVKPNNWIDCYDKLRQTIAAEFERHQYILQGDALTQQQQEDFKQIIKRTASQAIFENALINLSLYLQKYYNQNVVILIDEYDTPIHAGYFHKYYEEIILFMRGFLGGGLKGNANLVYGVLTGILRIARESIFSDMNNLDVHTLLSNHYADKFGFTEKEVDAFLCEYNLREKLGEARLCYNGYRVGKANEKKLFTKIYNPWSMLKYIQNNGDFEAYWANTSDNKLIQDLMQRASWDFKKDFEYLLSGGVVSKKISEDTVFASLETDSNALWSFLVFSGYLTWQKRERTQIECKADLIVPNAEVSKCFATLIDRWFSQSKTNYAYQAMLVALVDGDVDSFKRMFSKSILEHFSFFDVGGDTPENVYHAYALGLFTGLRETHAVVSNRESGVGRYDVCIIPHDKTKIGSVIEFKVFDLAKDKTMENCAQKALDQIEEKKYEAELHTHGVTKIIKYGIAFDKKAVLVVAANNAH